MILLLLADGFEEIEALTPLDVLRRLGADVKTAGISGNFVTGSHGITVKADILPEEVNLDEIEHIILPGGMPGSINLDASPYTDAFINAALSRGGKIGAICAAPLVLGRRGLLKNKEAVCYPGFEAELKGAVISEKSVVTDGNITTAKGMGAALAFSKRLAKEFLGASDSQILSLSKSIMEI